MATATVVPALKALDAELTSVAPQRTLPTWYRGDTRHQGYPSGHNPDDTPGSKAEYSDADSNPDIRAGDYRLPLRAKFTPEQLVQYLVKECRAGRITWIAYIIFNKRIWSASTGWVTREYHGTNPHKEHFHVSSKADTKSENSTKKVGLASLLPKPTPPKPPAKPSTPAAKPPFHKNGSRVNSRTENNYGTDVATLQRWLGIKDDGRFGPETEKRVKEYQALRGLRRDGVAGPNTWRPILSAL